MLSVLAVVVLTVRVFATPPPAQGFPDTRAQAQRVSDSIVSTITLRLKASPQWRVVEKDASVDVEVTRVRELTKNQWTVHLVVLGPARRSTALVGSGETALAAAADAAERLTRWVGR